MHEPEWIQKIEGRQSALLKLGWPPSTNHYWRLGIVKGKPRPILTDKARAYRANTAADVAEQGLPKFKKQRLRVWIGAHPRAGRTSDLDNLLKQTLDALEYSAVYRNDSQVKDLRIIECDRDPEGNGYLMAYIETMEVNDKNGRRTP